MSVLRRYMSLFYQIVWLCFAFIIIYEKTRFLSNLQLMRFCKIVGIGSPWGIFCIKNDNNNEKDSKAVCEFNWAILSLKWCDLSLFFLFVWKSTITCFTGNSFQQIVFFYVKKQKNYEKLCYEIKVFAKPFVINIGLN